MVCYDVYAVVVVVKLDGESARTRRETRLSYLRPSFGEASGRPLL